MRLSHTLALAAACFAALGAPFARAEYPEKTVRVIVPYPPGGNADAMARLVFGQLSERLKQQFIIENKGGASGTLGAGEVARAAPDGYTLLHDATAHSVNPSLYPKLPYNTLTAFAPIVHVMRVPNVLIVPANSPHKTLADYVAAARAKPGTINFGSSGNGGAQHLAGELFAQGNKLSLVHVPYKGGGPAMTDLIGGQLDSMFSTTTTAGAQVKSGRARLLAVSSAQRLPDFPNVPTLAEAGSTSSESYEWNGVFAPAGTPSAILDKLERELKAVLQLPQVQQRMADVGAQPVGGGQEALRAFVKSEVARWTGVIKTAGIKVE